MCICARAEHYGSGRRPLRSGALASDRYMSGLYTDGMRGTGGIGAVDDVCEATAVALLEDEEESRFDDREREAWK